MATKLHNNKMAAGQDVPYCLKWSAKDVAEWIGSLGYPQYKECFTSNIITGRKLIWINSSNLPKIGITDWKDIQVISKEVRDLLHIEDPCWNKSISLPPASELHLFLERKSKSGRHSDELTFKPTAMNKSID
ncbi:PREDICTED: sterile alpha motif domain-containing protein 15-like [Amphimedon queenslandica]|uniref:SAM domain-containing protein n=1 Tax=Amphimedon queenslandica TaxID=400682 RepID=A0AAN0IB65_AMPQE|nr:PREDICTED: sterile alpha motif domain-containing protein 15-like [Amphimedon queenslandica]|eukprot:XP_003384153.2 PREDICTED: sterile alpha motif domain-containing protein 15-like [Amphimedon queenslandica]